MKKLILLGLFVGTLAGCFCGLFECKKNSDGTVTSSCCGCSHSSAADEHCGAAETKTAGTDSSAEDETVGGSAQMKSDIPVEGAETLAEIAVHNAEVAAV